MAFFNELEDHVGTDIRSGESFSILATQEYIVAPPSAGVTKVVLNIIVTVDGNSPATRNIEAEQLELVAPNTPRFNFDPVTLVPLGLLIEPAATNLVSGDMATDWARDKITLEQIYQSIGVAFPTCRMQGDGVNGTHALAISLKHAFR